MFGYIWVYSMSSDCNMMYSIHIYKVVSPCLVITGYIQCPPIILCCILYISLSQYIKFGKMWVYSVFSHYIMFYSITIPKDVST